MACDGIELTDTRIAALERKASDDEDCGEIETAHPGSQDTFCAGNLKGVGRIYQQTFIDTYSKVAPLQALRHQNADYGGGSTE